MIIEIEVMIKMIIPINKNPHTACLESAVLNGLLQGMLIRKGRHNRDSGDVLHTLRPWSTQEKAKWNGATAFQGQCLGCLLSDTGVA